MGVAFQPAEWKWREGCGRGAAGEVRAAEPGCQGCFGQTMDPTSTCCCEHLGCASRTPKSNSCPRVQLCSTHRASREAGSWSSSGGSAHTGPSSAPPVNYSSSLTPSACCSEGSVVVSMHSEGSQRDIPKQEEEWSVPPPHLLPDSPCHLQGTPPEPEAAALRP